MILTEKNIEKWKESVRKKMLKKHGIDGYDKTRSNKEWLEDYLGCDETAPISDEEDCME